jgi:hypothetical protein
MPGRAFFLLRNAVSLRPSESHIAGMEDSMRLGRVIAVLTGAALIAAVTAANAAAQDSRQDSGRPIAGAVEGIIGHAVFADDSPIHHSVFGIAAPLRVTKGLALGPEVVRMIGPGDDRDWILAAAVWVDLVSATPLRAGKVVPFVSGGFGLLSHSDRFGNHNNLYYSGGGGVRIHLTKRLYIAPEILFASELHLRTVARIGYHIPQSR